jgi:hypothetical protein
LLGSPEADAIEEFIAFDFTFVGMDCSRIRFDKLESKHLPPSSTATNLPLKIARNSLPKAIKPIPINRKQLKIPTAVYAHKEILSY